MDAKSRKLVPESAIADQLGVSIRTLQGWRHRGVGPPYLKLGSTKFARVRYDPAAVAAWSNERGNRGDDVAQPTVRPRFPRKSNS